MKLVENIISVTALVVCSFMFGGFIIGIYGKMESIKKKLLLPFFFILSFYILIIFSCLIFGSTVPNIVWIIGVVPLNFILIWLFANFIFSELFPNNTFLKYKMNIEKTIREPDEANPNNHKKNKKNNVNLQYNKNIPTIENKNANKEEIK